MHLKLHHLAKYHHYSINSFLKYLNKPAFKKQQNKVLASKFLPSLISCSVFGPSLTLTRRDIRQSSEKEK